MALLLERRGMVSAINSKDWTPLHVASERAATLDAMRMLLEAGADPGMTAGWTFGVTPRELAVAQPEGSQAAALLLDGLVDLLSECHLVELLQDGFVEPFADAVGLGRFDFGLGVVDVVDGQEQLVIVPIGAPAIFRSPIR